MAINDKSWYCIIPNADSDDYVDDFNGEFAGFEAI